MRNQFNFADYHDYEPVSQSRRDLGFVLKPFLFVVLIWFVFWLDQRFMLDLYRFGILPRHFDGLLGVITSPLLHGSLMHLTNNTLPILALGMGLFYFYPRIAFTVVIITWLSSGLGVWFIGRESYHIGASSVIYALAAFIFLSGVLRRQGNLLALSLLVVFLYGGLVWGVFPMKENISWEAHLAGGISGFVLAVFYRHEGPVKRRYSWDEEPDEQEDKTDLTSSQDIEEASRTQKEAWEEYAKSMHGIRYIYRKKDDIPDNGPE